MSKIPKNPSEIFQEITGDYQGVFGDDLIAIILYGSGASGDYDYKKSDINFLIILSEAGINSLSKCLPLVRKWRKRNVTTPLFLTKKYISSALDAFPIEFLGMSMNYQLVFGADVLKEISISENDLRLALEREMRGKLVHLREGFLNTAHSTHDLRLLISKSLATFTTHFSALLKLKKIALPEKRRDIFMKTAEHFGLDTAVFAGLLEIRETRKHLSQDELQVLMEKYIHEIAKLTQIIDQL